MISSLRGCVMAAHGNKAVIDVNGVGYAIECSGTTVERLRAGGDEPQAVLTEMRLKQDEIVLYGFHDETERAWFLTLTTVQGVGPKHALSILGTLSPHELSEALRTSDTGAISRAKNVGPKLAKRIAAEIGASDVPAADDERVKMAKNALAGLGYDRSEAESMALTAVGAFPEGTVADIVTKALRDAK